MDRLTKKEYASFKKEGIKYDTEAEYEEAAQNLYNFVKLSYDLAQEHHRWEQRLKEEPRGFWLDSEGRTCYVCYTNVSGKIWFDKWGLKCENCQAAFEKKIFPGYVMKDKDYSRHITDSQLSWKFGIHKQTIKKLVRDGRIKARTIPNGPMIFLRKENPDLSSIIASHHTSNSSR